MVHLDTMKHFVTGLSLIFKRKDTIFVIIFATVFFMLGILLLQNGKASYSVFDFTFLPLSRRLGMATSTFFDIQNTFTVSALVLAFLGSFLSGINISLAYLYMRLRGRVVLHSGLYSGIGLLFAFFGVGCAACGTALLGLILGFFGLSAVLNILPYHGEEIGYLGIIIVCIATYTLARKVALPNVC